MFDSYLNVQQKMPPIENNFISAEGDRFNIVTNSRRNAASYRYLYCCWCSATAFELPCFV